MKRIATFAMIVLVASALQAMGQAAAAGKPGQAATAAMKCTGSDGKSACTAQQVTDLNSGITSGKRQHDPLRLVRGVALGRNGTLQCTQNDGSACTEQQIAAIMAIAPSTHSRDGEIRIVREVDRASPLM
jgi:hypothetical protein